MKIYRRQFLEIAAASTITAGAGVSLLGLGTTNATAQDLSDLMTPGPMGEKWLGEENAPVTVIEYASMTCGHCKSFHEQVLPGLKEKYVDSGKVRLIFREFPFDPRAVAAFMLARCAPEERYFPLIDVLFKQQAEWARVNDPVPPLEKIAKLAGFTQESFEACLKNQKVLDSVLAVQKKAQETYGVNATPTFFIQGEKYAGDYTVEALSAEIDSHL